MIAPAIIDLERKSRFSPSRIAKHLRRAAARSRDVHTPRAVMMDGRCVGITKADLDGRVRVREMSHREWMRFTTYADLDAAASSGRYVEIDFYKDLSGWNKAQVWGDMWTVGPESGGYSGVATARPLDVSTVGSLKGLILKSPTTANARFASGHRLTCMAANAAESWTLEVCDRVLSYDGCSITTIPTNMTNTLPGARYISSGQPGLKIVPTIQAALGVTASNLSALTVTDNLGNAAVVTPTVYVRPWYANGNAGTGTAPAPVACPVDASNLITISPWLSMPGGVTGARKIEAFTSSAINTGTISFAMVFPIFTAWVTQNGIVNIVDYARTMTTLPKVYDTACLNVIGIENSGNASKIMGAMTIGHLS